MERATRTVAKHRGCCIDQTTILGKPQALDDDPSSAIQVVDRRRREPVMTVQQAVPVPAICEVVSGWIDPPSANRGSTTDRLDQTIQKYHELQKKASDGEDSYDSIVEVVREIKAAMDRDKKLFKELKEKVEALTVALDRFNKQQQEQQTGRVISGVLSFFPISEAIKSMLADLLTDIVVRSCRDKSASS